MGEHDNNKPHIIFHWQRNEEGGWDEDPDMMRLLVDYMQAIEYMRTKFSEPVPLPAQGPSLDAQMQGEDIPEILDLIKGAWA